MATGGRTVSGGTTRSSSRTKPIAQIVNNRGSGFGNRTLNVVDFQGPNGVRGSFSSAFLLAGLVEIANVGKGGELFFPLSHRSRVFCRGLGRNGFLLDGRFLAGFLSVRLVTSFFRAVTTSEGLFTNAVERWPGGRRISTAY